MLAGQEKSFSGTLTSNMQNLLWNSYARLQEQAGKDIYRIIPFLFGWISEYRAVPDH